MGLKLIVSCGTHCIIKLNIHRYSANKLDEQLYVSTLWCGLTCIMERNIKV